MPEIVLHDTGADEQPQGLPAAESDHRHEQRDANIRLVALAGGILIALALGILLSIAWALALFRRTPAPIDVALPPIRAIQTPSPGLWRFPEPDHLTPQQNYANQRRAEARLLTTYGWIDRPHGIVRLPIERAKDLLLANPAPATAVQPPAAVSAPENEVHLSSEPVSRGPLSSRPLSPQSLSSGQMGP
jgi:hypothetical protein